MSVDDFVKIILAVSASISLLVVSIQLGRFFGTLSATLKQMQETIENVNILSRELVEDYQYVREMVESLGRVVSKIEVYLLDPAIVAYGIAKDLLGGFSTLLGKVDNGGGSDN